MRDQWRLLLLRTMSCSRLHSSSAFSQSQSHAKSNICGIRTLSSLLHSTARTPASLTRITNASNPPLVRNLSSEPALEQKELDHVVVADIFSRFGDRNDIRKEIELSNAVINHDMVLRVLRSLEGNPDVARRFFDWVLENDPERLSSKGYNLMLRVLGVNGLVKEFWSLVGVMKQKGYGVSKVVHDKVLEKFQREGLDDDVGKLKALYASGSTDYSVEKICIRMCRIIRNQVWGDEVERKLKDLNVAFSSELVKMVPENLYTDPMKALIFFRWIQEGGLFKHDEQTYNSMARVLGREDCIDRFWNIADEMRSVGYEMEAETYAKVSERFVKQKMIKDAVYLYEFAMAGVNKPSVESCTFLLRKVVVGKSLDMSLFSKVVSVCTRSGNVLTGPMLDAVLKALTSVGRLGDCNKVLKAMEEGGFVPSGIFPSKIAHRLSSAGKKDEASQCMDFVEASQSNLDDRTWISLIEGYCEADNLQKATDLIQKMVEKEEIASVGDALDVLVDAYCHKNRAHDACKLLCDLVGLREIKPWHSTYNKLIRKLLVQGGFKDALNLLGLMRNHGFHPFVEPFMKYISKSGNADDAIAFLKAVTSKRFPSTCVFLHLFESFLKEGRHSEAQDVLSKCPPYIRSHADVLELFCAMKSGRSVSVAAVTS